jgi:hypothetical protein
MSATERGKQQILKAKGDPDAARPGDLQGPGAIHGARSTAGSSGSASIRVTTLVAAGLSFGGLTVDLSKPSDLLRLGLGRNRVLGNDAPRLLDQRRSRTNRGHQAAELRPG